MASAQSVEERRWKMKREMRSVKRLMFRVPRHCVAWLVALLLVFTSCERRELEIYNTDKVLVRIDVDWMKSFGIMPTGMTLMLYQDGDQLTLSRITNDVTSQQVQLTPGVYKLIIFNQSYDEFGSMHFENLNSHDKAAARAENITTRANRTWDKDVVYITDPEDIGVAVDTFEITEEMLERQLTFYNWKMHDKVTSTTDVYVYNEVPDPMTTVLHVKANVRGARNIAGMEASISGMADGFYLSKVDRTTETGTMFLNQWKFKAATDSTDYGVVSTSIPCFGLPYGKETVAARDSTDNVLELNFFLTDGTEYHRTFNVGKIMKYLTPSGDALTKAEVLKHIIVEIYIEEVIDIPDVDPSKTASGFDAEVDDWDFGGTFEFSLGKRRE